MEGSILGTFGKVGLGLSPPTTKKRQLKVFRLKNNFSQG